jgi:uncharacterized protein YcbK (DUF882 family)
MKDISELNPHCYKTNPNIDKNLKTLFDRLLELQAAYKMDLVITSGLRDQAQQDELIAQGKTNARHSKHLSGNAADILDEDGILKSWLSFNVDLLTTIGFWMEDPKHTPTWVHVQIIGPMSGKRVFIP